MHSLAWIELEALFYLAGHLSIFYLLLDVCITISPVVKTSQGLCDSLSILWSIFRLKKERPLSKNTILNFTGHT